MPRLHALTVVISCCAQAPFERIPEETFDEFYARHAREVSARKQQNPKLQALYESSDKLRIAHMRASFAELAFDVSWS